MAESLGTDQPAIAEGSTLAAGVEEEIYQRTLRSQLLGSKIGKSLVGGMASIAALGGGGLLAANVNARPDFTAKSASTQNAMDSSPSLMLPSTVTIETQQGSAKASDVATKRIVFLEDVHARGSTKSMKPANCFWDKNFENSGHDANGRLIWFKDHNGLLCRDKNSPSGWVKMAGGMTGRHCGNPASPNNIPRGREVPAAEVIILPKLNVRFKLHALAIANVLRDCGTASARAEVSQWFNLKTFLRASGVKEVKIALNLYDRAYAKASANVNCQDTSITITAPTPTTTSTTTSTTPTTTTTTSTTTSTTPTSTSQNYPPFINVVQKTPGFEGVNEGDQVVVCADANSSPTSDGVTVTATDKYGQLSSVFQSGAEYCVGYTAPSTPHTDEDITMTARDNVNGLTATDSTGNFPVRQPQ